MGSPRECTRILGLKGFGSSGSNGKGMDQRQACACGLNGEGSAASNASAVDDGRGACEITRCGPGTTYRGPSTAWRSSMRKAASGVGPAGFARSGSPSPRATPASRAACANASAWIANRCRPRMPLCVTASAGTKPVELRKRS
jgi:hypothetical protein